MEVISLTLAIVVILSIVCGATIWYFSRHRQINNNEKSINQAPAATTLSFQWTYIILPLAILILSLILVAYFYHQLPTEIVYRFKDDGSPDSPLINRGAITLWLLVPQFLLTLLAGMITWGITRLSRLFQQISTDMKLERVLVFMGNMIALPQIILCFAMLDIFSYNSYQIHIMPLRVFVLIVIGLGGIVLSIFFIRTIRQVLGASR